MEVLSKQVHYEMEEKVVISGNYWLLLFLFIVSWVQLQQFCKSKSSLI